MSESDNAPLAAQLRSLGDALRREQPPAQLLAGIHRRIDAKRKPAPRGHWLWAAAGVACMAGVALMAVMAIPPAEDEAQADVLAGFVPVAGSERWREASQGNAWLVATELPRARLAAWGLPYDPARAGDTVRAQLLLHSSGDVLAVRVIR